jgi:hypothetical protein
MGRDRKCSDEVKKHRREALDAGMAAFGQAVEDGDEDAAARELDTMKALDLLVPDECNRLQPGPDVAD